MSSREPFYFSHKEHWRNGANFSEIAARNRKFNVNKIRAKFAAFLESCNNEISNEFVPDIVVRQVVMEWIYNTAYKDGDLHEFDKKVGLDAIAVLKENLPDNY